MFNTQYNRQIANEVAKINEKYAMRNQLHGEELSHNFGRKTPKEESEILSEIKPLMNLAKLKEGGRRAGRPRRKVSDDFTDMEGGGFWGDVWHGVKKGVSGVAEIAPDVINLASSVGLGKPKKTRGRPKKVGGAISAGAMSAGAMSAGAMSAGAMSAGAMSAGAKKYKKKKVVGGALSAGALSAGAISGGAHGDLSFEDIIKKGLKKIDKKEKVVKEKVVKEKKIVSKKEKAIGKKISPKERGEMVKHMMKTHGVKLGEASKMVSQHLKGGGFFKSLLHLAPLALPLLL